MTYVLCVTGVNVLGNAQRVEVPWCALSELRRLLEKNVQFTPENLCFKIDSMNVYDYEFDEYVLLQTEDQLHEKAKLRLECSGTAPSPAHKVIPMQSETPSSAMKQKTTTPTATKAYYTHVIDNMLLPCLERITGKSADAISEKIPATLKSVTASGTVDFDHPEMTALETDILSFNKKSTTAAPLSVTPLKASDPITPNNITPGKSPAIAFADKKAAMLEEPDEDEETWGQPRKARKSAGPRKAAGPPKETEQSPSASFPAPTNHTMNQKPGFDIQKAQNVQAKAPVGPNEPVDSILLYCVYSGSTCQRAKAIRVDRTNPNLSLVIDTLKQKFHSELCLGFIETDGVFSEIITGEEFKQLIKRHKNQPSVTVHCWEAAPKVGDVSGAISEASATTPMKSGQKKNKSSRPTSAASNRSVTSNRSQQSNRSKKSTRSAARDTGTGKLDVSGAYYTDEQLQELFDELDVTNDGYLDKNELRVLFDKKYDPMGVDDANKKFESFLGQCSAMDDGRLTYDEFCIVMLKLAQW